MKSFLFQIPCVLSANKSENKYKYEESDERIHRLEDYVSNEILTYLRLLRLENEQRLRQLSQSDQSGGQQYLSDYGDLEWSQGQYDQDWLQDSYDSFINPGQIAMWQNSPFGNRRFPNTGVGRSSKMPPLPLANGGRLRNTVPPFPPFSYGMNGANRMPGSFSASYPLEGENDNGYMQFYRVPSEMSKDQLGNQIASLSPDSYNLKLQQLPGGRKQKGTLLTGLETEGSITSPSTISTTPGKMTSTTIGSIGGSPKRSNMKISSVPNSGQTTINIDSTDSESTFETGVRSLPPKSTSSASSVSVGETKPGNKKYRVLLVNGDEGEEISFDDVHKKLFSSRGFDSTGGVNTVAAAASSSSGGHPQHSFQTVSVSNNGKGATITSSPTSKSTNTISLQSGDESLISSFGESKLRGLGTKYKNSGLRSFEGMNGLVTNGYQNLRLN